MYTWHVHFRYFPDDGGTWYLHMPRGKQRTTAETTIGFDEGDIVAATLGGALHALSWYIESDLAEDDRRG